ncbi:hypothetical protein Riv7116_4155 [Rivularia sp. PCC 7116]|nr:hypothetical protein Riv7116_4155 [Rivularia sp. PCC 7116]
MAVDIAMKILLHLRILSFIKAVYKLTKLVACQLHEGFTSSPTSTTDFEVFN